MMRSISGFTVTLLATGVALGQTPEAKPAFEAAFLKANTTASTSSSSNGTKGQLVMVNQTLKRLIERAYSVKPFQVTGPEWMENIHFDVTAKYPENSKAADRPVMLRTLLEERFKLATHMETKELPGYALVVAKGGLKIKPAEPGNDGTSSNSNGKLVTFRATSLNMAGLADYLARRLGATVVDSTDAPGVYTFELRWSLEDPNGGSDGSGAAAAEFAAIQEAIGTLGLRLQTQKVPVQVIVVDHIERVPTEN